MALIHEHSRDWVSLPVHLLDMIVVNLVEFSDFIHFAAVCKPWFSVAIHNKKFVSSHKQVPMLLVPSVDQNSQRHSLYDIIENTHYNFEPNLSCTKRCCGSSHGWLATLEQDYSITLINPFITSGANSITLPPVIEKTENHDYNHHEYDIHKIILSSNPREDENCVVLAVVPRKLAFIKHGDKDWTRIPNQGHGAITDVIYYKGNFYATNQLGNTILSLDVKEGLMFNVEVIDVEPVQKWELEGMSQTYLVESSTGDLLLVQRCFVEEDDTGIQYMTSDFKVSKLKGLDGKRGTCIELNNLGDQALFLGDNHSFFVVASKFPGLQQNSIYYTDDFYYLTTYWPHGPRDMGIFDLESKSFKAHYTPNPLNKKLPPPIWVMPTLQGRMNSGIGEEHKNLLKEKSCKKIDRY